MTEYTISDRILHYLRIHCDFRRLAERTANEAIDAMNDPCAFIVTSVGGVRYVGSHNYSNRYTALDCMYSDNHEGRTVLEVY